MWKSRVSSWTSRIKRTIDLIYGGMLIEVYLYIIMRLSRRPIWAYSYAIHILISRRCIRISCDRSKSIAHSMIPIWRCDWGYFSWRSLWRIRRIWLCIRREVVHRAVYTSEDKKSEECTEPFLLSILTLSWNEMFHKLYKKSKIIITYIISFVNTYLIIFIIVKYQFSGKVDFFSLFCIVRENILHSMKYIWFILFIAVLIVLVLLFRPICTPIEEISLKEFSPPIETRINERWMIYKYWQKKWDTWHQCNSALERFWFS